MTFSLINSLKLHCNHAAVVAIVTDDVLLLDILDPHLHVKQDLDPVAEIIIPLLSVGITQGNSCLGCSPVCFYFLLYNFTFKTFALEVGYIIFPFMRSVLSFIFNFSPLGPWG